jgi:hypothetical protein
VNESRGQVTAKSILATAQSKKTSIDQNVIRETSAKFLEAGKTNPDAWNVALAFIDYKSFLNIGPGPIQGPITLATKSSYLTAYEPPSSAGTMYSLGYSTPPEVPQYRPIDHPDMNQGKTVGPQFLRVVGGEVRLDGYYIKRVILENVHVIYRGGALTLENVYFVNCTFDVSQQPRGQELANKLLEPSLSVSAKLV